MQRAFGPSNNPPEETKSKSSIRSTPGAESQKESSDSDHDILKIIVSLSTSCQKLTIAHPTALLEIARIPIKTLPIS